MHCLTAALATAFTSPELLPELRPGQQHLRLTPCPCTNTSVHSPAPLQVRHQPPVGFLGLWPEFSLLNHSCTPNVAITVVKGTMLLHASDLLQQGQELATSYLGRAVMAPLQQRRQMLQDGYGFECGCGRCGDCSAGRLAHGLLLACAWLLPVG